MEPSTSTTGFAEHKPAYLETAEQTLLQVTTTQFNQSQLLPGSTTQQQLGNIVTVSHLMGQAYLFATTVLASTTNVVRIEVRDDYGRVFLPAPECGVYTGTSTTTGVLPQGLAWPNASYAMSNFPVSIIPIDIAYSDDTHAVTTFAMRNNSVNTDVPVVVAIRWRLVVNAAATFQRSDSTSV